MKIKLIVDGGKMAPGPAVAQQLGPMGINLGKVISDVNEATKGFAGIKVPVELDVDSKTKKYVIQVFSPPVSELIKKELGLEKGSGEALKTKVGNISIESLIGIAKTKMPNLLAKNLKSGLKLVVGSCVSLGVLVESKEAAAVEKEIDAGVYDVLIDEEITSPTPEKKRELDDFFKNLKVRQEQQKKAEEEAKAAAEAAKLAATAATPAATPAAGAAAPAAGEKKEDAKAPAKAAAKPAEAPKKK